MIKKITFFDTGIPDIIAYARLYNITLDPKLEQTGISLRYNRKVFFASPWEKIYHIDPERKETFAEAVKIFHKKIETYQDFKYISVYLPLASVETRIEIIVKNIISK